VTVLVPSATVAGRVRAIALPWVAGVAAITLVLLPIAMALLHRAYTVARRGSMRANDELRQEIAKRERDQEELRRLASFPELNPNAVVETDPDGQLHYLNPGVRRMMPDLAASGLDHPFMAQMAKIAEELRDSVTTTYGPQAVMRIVRVDDRWFHQIIYSVDASTQSSRLRIYAFDVTEQADSERKLRAAHQELQEAHARQARQVRELQGRDRLVRLQMQGTSVARARTEILEVMSHALGLRQVVFYEPSADGEGLEATASLTGEGLASESGAEASMPFLSLHCEDNLAVQSYVEQQPRCSDRRDEAAVPIVFGDTVLGVVWTGDAEGEGRLDEVAPYTMWRLGQQAALLLRMARVTEGLEDGAFCVAELLALE